MQKKPLSTENISIFNPWLRDGNFRYSEKEFTKRRAYFEAEKALKKNLILSVIGLRRTGKTTILRQLINALLASGISPRNIFFYEFDEDTSSLEDILRYYFESILREEIRDAKCYIFLDELQFIENWQTVLKRYYDVNPNIQFIVSGSTHLFLHKNTRESLAGRIRDVHVRPFGWHEFLRFKYDKGYAPVDALFSDDFLDAAGEASDILLHKDVFFDYLSFGEYPYYFHETDTKELERYYKDSVLEKIFTKDIALFDVSNRRAFLELFQVLNRDTAQEINIQNLSREIGLSAITVKRYIDILGKMFLYTFLYKEEKSLRAKVLSFKKGYVSSLNLLRASLNADFWSMEHDQLGHVVETFVYNELVKNDITDITFFHDTKVKKEVDFVCRDGSGKAVPIEVKVQSVVSPAQMRNLVYFAKKNGMKRCVLLYGGSSVEQKTMHGVRVECVPYWIV